MKILKGSEIAGFVKERQARQVRRLRQAYGVQPRLAIIQTVDIEVINTYVRKKQEYGADIGVTVDVLHPQSGELVNKIDQLNRDPSTHGIIVQLPLAEPVHTERVLNSVNSAKDVDGLAAGSLFKPATPTAINWLLSGYDITLEGKKIVVLGKGILVGGPLIDQWQAAGQDVVGLDRGSSGLAEVVRAADIIVSATGQAGLVTSEMVKPGAVLVDAGTTVAEGRTVGDVAPEVYERDDITRTPRLGGVGPLTVAALFENVLLAAERQAASVS